MLRRAASSLLARGLPLAQQQGSGAAPLAAAFNHLPAFGFSDDKPSSASSAQVFRPYATASELAVAQAAGMTATTYAMKNPTPTINYDTSNQDPFPVGDPSKRAFTYFVLTGGRFIYASAVRLAVLKFILSMTATKDVLALANLEVDLKNIEEGQTVTVKWRGKPVFVRRRTEAEIAEARDVPMSALRDPQPDDVRVINPEWLVVVGVCTHLGCVPLPGAGDYNGWFCPCHGSHYDTSGRIRKGPAPTNLEVPEYKFIEEQKVIIG